MTYDLIEDRGVFNLRRPGGPFNRYRRQLKEKGVCFHFCGLSRAHYFQAPATQAILAIYKTDMLSGKIWWEADSDPDMSRWSSFKVIVLSSLIYPYFELDSEQKAIRKLLLIPDIFM